MYTCNSYVDTNIAGHTLSFYWVMSCHKSLLDWIMSSGVYTPISPNYIQINGLDNYWTLIHHMFKASCLIVHCTHQSPFYSMTTWLLTHSSNLKLLRCQDLASRIWPSELCLKHETIACTISLLIHKNGWSWLCPLLL